MYDVVQIKPLTEEEKKQRLAELREKMAAKRAVKAKQEAEEAKANELIRRKGGQVCTPRQYTVRYLTTYHRAGSREGSGRTQGEASQAGPGSEEAR